MKMKKYIISDTLQSQIDWENIMKMPRCAGGHDEQMRGLFKGAEVLGHWKEGDYQGMVATCVQLSDGRFVIYNDFYGSCSGCESWEDASDVEVRAMCINLANGAYIFETLEDVKEFLKNVDELNYPWSYSANALLKEIEDNENPPKILKINGYYLTQRPPSIGTHPADVAKIEEVFYKNRNCHLLHYDRELSYEEMKRFELTPNIEFDGEIEAFDMIFEVKVGDVITIKNDVYRMNESPLDFYKNVISGEYKIIDDEI